VTTHDRAVARRLGIEGVVLSVAAAPGATTGRVGVKVDYRGFAGAVGGDWSSRLRLVSLPACALTTPEVSSCRVQTAVPSSNDTRTASVSAETDLPAAPASELPSTAGVRTTGTAGTQRVLALAAAASGAAGSYAATDLSPSARWEVGPQTGTFSWSYPLGVPPSVNGPAPQLALGYSSSAIDGRTLSTNNQSSWIGDGWDLETGYIERRYVACADDKSGGNNANVAISGDLCWRTDNASLVLAGHSGELVKVSTGSTTVDGTATTVTTWKLKSDDGTKVERFTALGTNADKDKEYWRVTTPDGTRYSFGLGKRYGSDTANTQSTWTVPVAGNQSGEPCYASTFAASFCTRAWRWNLDYVTDPYGNSMTYHYKRATNNYGQNNNAKVVTYDRGGWLDHVDYGERAGSEATTTAPARVLFGVSERCIPSGTITCAENQLTSANASSWPDTPFDQICTSTTSCSSVVNPAFFSRKRLTSVTTQVWDASLATPAYKDVDSWALAQSFPATGDGTSPALWLSSVAHTGKAGTATTLPTVNFTGVQLENRVPNSSGDPLLIKWRISSIATETGSEIAVNYMPAECSASVVPSSPATNTKRCSPAYWTPLGASAPLLTYFHKYPISSITEKDLTGGGPAVVTSYSYLDSPAYHFDDSELVQPKYRTWGDYRGYGRVQVTHGDSNATRTATEFRYLRGMDQDCATASGGACATRKSVSVTDSRGTSVADHERANGWQLEQITFRGVGGPEVTGQVDTPWISAATAASGNDKAYLMAAARSETRTALAAGGYRTTRIDRSYDSTYGLVTQVDDQGDVSSSAGRDEVCTRYEYARNTGLGVVDTVSRVETLSVACGATVNRPADVVSDVRTYYDGTTTFGAAPTKGSVTKTEVLTGWSSGAVYTKQSGATYDAHGRVATSTDALGHVTTTSYTPATGGPVTGVTTKNALDHSNTTTLDPARGHAVAEVDANGRRTDLQYDALGRLQAVWMPGHNKASFASSPNLVFQYTISKTAPVVVRTRELRANGTDYTDSYAIFDGLLRSRQAQAPAEGSAGGRVVTETKYDSLGRAVNENGPWWNSSAPSGTLLDALDTDKQAVTVRSFDGAGRVTDEILMSGGVEKWRTTTAYGGDRVSVTPPAGAPPTTTITDARGRVTALRQYKGSTPTGSYDETLYTYRPDGNRATVTTAGATWRYGYDVRGRLTSTTDPDAGTSTTTYDAANRVTSTTDARSKSLFYEYDALDRRTAVRDGSATGPVLASWVYDTLVKGKLTSATRYVGSNAYVQAVTGYDDAYRPTGGSVTIPSSEGLLAGTYTTSASYNLDGGIKTITPAKLPGLPDETQAFGYTALGNPKTLGSSGVGSYVNGTTYSVFGEAQQYAMGPTVGKTVWQTNTYDPVTRRLTRIQAQREGVAGADADLAYSHDPAGNVTKIKDTATGQAETQCFSHDHLRRLTEAWTPTDDCAAAPSLSLLGGPSPYWTSWTYDASGNRTTQVSHASAGDTTSTYAYPDAGAARPHAVQSVTTTGPAGSKLDEYTYDSSGNTIARTLAGVAETMTWDSEGHLASHVKGAQTTSFVYNADGGRLIRREPNAVTLYLDNAELRLDTTANTVTSTRYYVFNGDTVALRTSAGVKLLISDHQGTADISVDGTTGAVARRRFTPFGQLRGTAPSWPSDRGFVGGVKDSTTGLTHLGAREYDPSLGRFVSVDPIMDVGDPQQLNGYSYASNSPVTASDPSGAYAVWDPVNGGYTCYNGCATEIGEVAKKVAKDGSQPKPSYGGSPQGAAYSSDPAAKAAQARAEARAKLAALAKARAAQEAQKRKLIAAAKALLKIAADELGITAALDCLTSGNLGACAETALNVVSSFAGGLAGKLMAKYGMPWKWAKGARLVKTLWRLGGEAIDALKGWFKAGREVDALEDAAASAVSAQRHVLAAAADSCPIGNSFTPDTKVVMADGSSKPIGSVALGDRVLAADPVTGAVRGEPVRATIVSEGSKHLVEVTVTGGQTLTATDGHPFWLPSQRRWVPAGDLRTGDQLLTPAGALVQVTAAKAWTALTKVNNLGVADLHTYYVLAGTTPVLVHNCGSSWVPNPDYSPEAIAGRSAQWQKHIDNLNGRAAQKAVARGRGPREIGRIDAPEEHVPGSQWHAQGPGRGSPGINMDGTYHDGNPHWPSRVTDWLAEYGWRSGG
jgi:RHS repeat-associated protein